MKPDVYWEVRTKSGFVVQQFTNTGVMERWFSRRKNFSYLPSYEVFKITKTEEMIDVQVQECEPATRTGTAV